MTTFNQNFNNLVTATLQAHDQHIKIDPETEMNSKSNKIVDKTSQQKTKISFRIIKLSR